MILKTLFLFALTSTAVIEAGTINEKYASQTDEIIPETEILGSTDVTPRTIHKSHKTGNIYFANKFQTYFHVLKKGENRTQQIEIDALLQTLSVDNLSGYVYIGCDDGLKVYDEITGFVSPTGITGDIHDSWVSNDGVIYVYVLENNIYNLYSYNSSDSLGVRIDIPLQGSHLIKFLVDFDGNVYSKYYYNKKILVKALLNGSARDIQYGGTSSFQDIVVDKHNRVYGLAADAVYRLFPNDTVPQLTYKLPGVSPRTICFDENNNIIYVTKEGLIVLSKYNKVTNNTNMAEKNISKQNFGDKIDNVEKENELLRTKVTYLEEKINKQVSFNSELLLEIEAISEKQNNMTYTMSELMSKINKLEREKQQLHDDFTSLKNGLHNLF